MTQSKLQQLNADNRPDITIMVDWALKNNYLSIYLSNADKTEAVLTGTRHNLASISIGFIQLGDASIHLSDSSGVILDKNSICF